MKKDILQFIETLEDFKNTSAEKSKKTKKTKSLPLEEKIVVERNDAAVKLFNFVIKSLNEIVNKNECVTDYANRQVKK